MNLRGISIVLLLIGFSSWALGQKMVTSDQCPQIFVTSLENENSSEDRARFSATQIMDLQIHVAFSREVQGEHVLRLKLFTPDNQLYQELTQPVTGDALRLGALRSVDGFPRPLRVQTVQPLPVSNTTYSGITFRFPVAGTSIVSSSLYGKWRIEAFLDEQAGPCGRSTIFSIAP